MSDYPRNPPQDPRRHDPQQHPRYHRFDGRVVMLGFGSVGQALLPLLLRHLDICPDQVRIVKPSDKDLESAHEHGIPVKLVEVTEDNHQRVLEPLLGRGDFLVNLSVDVGSITLMALCQQRRALYIDASTEPWVGKNSNPDQPLDERTNYHLREQALALRLQGESRATALITMGANPGLVSLLLKRALLQLAGPDAAAPVDRAGWAALAQRLDVRVIHVAERDSQLRAERKQAGEFVNTWSIDGFVGEALQPAELGWGTHERHFPVDGGRHDSGCRSAIFLKRPGAATRVRSWAPLAGPYEGFLVTHAESISIADHLTVGDPRDPVYRPTVHYAYHPCDDTVLSLHELAGRQWRLQEKQTLIRDDIISGRDELGVLLMGPRIGAYWHGSQLTIDDARALCPDNSATSLQVAAPILAGMVWVMKNPERGIVEPDDLPHDELLPMIDPYLGRVVGVRSDWTPLQGRCTLFPQPLDRDDPWQFVNFRVA
jgi:homospermidine synthase